MKEIWDERYNRSEYVYGETPNLFVKDQLDRLQPGRVLFPAEGEGRNVVYAASLGWQADAFDISSEGRRKANLLAQKTGVQINYFVGGLDELPYSNEAFDAIVYIFTHVDPDLRHKFFGGLVPLLRQGGIVIFEAFSKNNLALRRKNPAIGGPDKIEMLFTTLEIEEEFKELETVLLEEREAELHEGLLHNGISSVVRYIGRKR
jgi:ubiquinone/menaquinone biosynthesis C-methylase UbiE